LEGHQKGVTCICISNDGAWIISGSKDKTLKIWKSSNGTIEKSLEEHEDDVTSVLIFNN
jgi:WD40 repeat protein